MKKPVLARRVTPHGTKTYRCRFFDHLEIEHWVTLYPQKDASEVARAQIERLVIARKNRRPLPKDLTDWLDSNPELKRKFADWDLVDAATAMSTENIIKLLAQWDAFREANGLSIKGRLVSLLQCKKIVEGCGFRTPSEISEAKMIDFLQGLTARGKSARTRNQYLVSFRTFINWLVKKDVLAKNPLLNIMLLNEQADRRHERRALTEDEIAKLLEATRTGDVHHGLTGLERAAIYALALETGLRWNEIRTLVQGDLLLDQNAVKVKAGNAKNRKEAEVAISGQLTALYKEILAKVPVSPLAKVFPTIWLTRGGEMLAEDLRAAGINPVNDKGEVVDFHALRHTFATRMALGGVQPRVLQSMMRHSTYDLTAKFYAHVGIVEKAKALAGAPLPWQQGNEDGNLGNENEGQKEESGDDGNTPPGNKKAPETRRFAGPNDGISKGI